MCIVYTQRTHLADTSRGQWTLSNDRYREQVTLPKASYGPIQIRDRKMVAHDYN